MTALANKQAICNTLLAAASNDKDIVVVCSDSRGSGSMTEFSQQYPQQFVEVGIAEQDLVGISAGLASCGKKVYAVSPASFLSARSMEQVKVDVAYSEVNVKLIGISGGVSYGALGMTHHSTNDVAVMASLPHMRVYLPSDYEQTSKLIASLLQDKQPAYIRVGRNAVEAIERRQEYSFNKADVLSEGTDAAIIACGELVQQAVAAARLLGQEGIKVRVIDMFCLKPLDKDCVLQAARECSLLLTLEEHVSIGGLGSMVAQATAEATPVKVISMTLPDAPVIAGNSKEVFSYYGLDADGVAKRLREELKKVERTLG